MTCDCIEDIFEVLEKKKNSAVDLKDRTITMHIKAEDKNEITIIPFKIKFKQINKERRKYAKVENNILFEEKVPLFLNMDMEMRMRMRDFENYHF